MTTVTQAHRLTITIAGHGRDETTADRVLDAFQAVHPEVGAVITQDTQADSMEITFSFDGPADDVDQAFAVGRAIFADGMTASRIEFKPAIAAHIEVLEPDSPPAADRELEIA